MPPDDRDPANRFEYVIEVLAKDFAAGRTIGALHERLDKHEGEDDERFTRLEGKMQKIEVQRAREQGRQEAAGRSVAAFPTGESGPNGTGRYQIVSVPVNGGLHVPTPPPMPAPMVAVNVGAAEPERRAHSMRPVMPSWLRKGLTSGVAKGVGIVLLLLAGWLARHLGFAAPDHAPEQPAAASPAK